MSRRRPQDSTDLYAKLYGPPKPAVDPAQAGASGRQPVGADLDTDSVSNFWVEGDRDPTKTRDVPYLYPYFYHAVLFANGKPLTAQNILAVVEYVSQSLGLQGSVWMQELADERTRTVFMDRFATPLDTDDRREHRPDDQIDFIWSWRTTARPGLRQFLQQTYAHLNGPTSQLKNYGPDLPFGIWSRD
ncbi:hypothetical protein ABZY09_27810 [Streptomyces sp. NPDC002928]|uniref:hypothetical protein n=1 Tax=Streptomyces sp. NPDC002928 TaxID=3154440 RepID=UPI0033BCB2A7